MVLLKLLPSHDSYLFWLEASMFFKEGTVECVMFMQGNK